MSIQQLKRDLAELKEAIKPKTPDYQVVIYNSPLRGDSEGRNIESIYKINGRDVSHLSAEEKEKMLSIATVHLYLPKKDPYPEGNCDYPAT